MKFVTLAELDEAETASATRTQWGDWTIDLQHYPSLDFHGAPYAHNPYWITLFEPGCSLEKYTAWLGQWVEHLIEKNWLTPQVLFDFVQAADSFHMYGAARRKP